MKLAQYFFSEYLEKKETVYYVVHKSFVIIVIDLFRILLLGFALPIGLWFLFPELLIPAILWMLAGLWKFLFLLYDWYYHVWLITDRAVLEIKSDSLFNVSTNRVEYHMVEGISYSIMGFWATFFRYGNMIVERAGSPAINFSNASSPGRAESMILKCQERYMDSRTTRDHKTLRELLAGMVREHAKEHGVPDTED